MAEMSTMVEVYTDGMSFQGLGGIMDQMWLIL